MLWGSPLGSSALGISFARGSLLRGPTVGIWGCLRGIRACCVEGWSDVMKVFDWSSTKKSSRFEYRLECMEGFSASRL